ncbi:SMP-30/gluconolactonase/LRE family protein [Mucilaginibacter kameinonensis]|uniref:SMP-30/gluconolactonase/LRE family protein n=1 Tax=Mucilaginibacter kameinonensis TaxID=452286 RepID=UPI001FC95378|nr:ATP-binding protein [Mucilaginibacter kameinonensis]
MKHFFKCALPALLAFMVQGVSAQTHRLEKLWETDSVVRVPESVLPDFKKQILYVSEIGGNSNTAAGKGGVAKIGLDGKIIDLDFTTDLNSAKGMGRFGDKLYVADLSELVVIDIKTGKVINKIVIDSAKVLNDVTVDSKGVVYVSDSKTFKIHRVEKGKVTTFLTQVTGVNGLKAIDNDLYIMSGPKFMKADSKGNLTQVATITCNGDGLEPVGNGDFLITCWAGHIFYVSADGKVEVLLDSEAQKMSTADLGYDTVNHILYVPTFFSKKVVAYKLVNN